MAVQPHRVFVALADCQPQTLVLFYRQFFGLEPAVTLPNYAEFELPGLRLGIFTPKADRQTEFAGRSGSCSLCIEVEALEPAIAHLTDIGYPPTAIVTASHGREVYAYDPAGNRLILHESRESAVDRLHGRP